MSLTSIRRKAAQLWSTQRLHRGDGFGARLIRATAGSAGLAVIGMAFTVLLGIQLARGLGAAGYGIYGLVMAVVAILGMPSHFGLPQLVTREVAAAAARDDWQTVRGVIRWSKGMMRITSAIIITLMLIWVVTAGPGITSEIGMTFLVGAFLIPIVAAVALRSAVLRGLMHLVEGQIPDTLVRPVVFASLLALLYLLAIPLTPSVAMACGLLSVLIALLIAGRMVGKRIPPVVETAEPPRQHRFWLSATVPMALTEGMRVIQAQVAIIALGLLSSLEVVGNFRVALSSIAIVALPLTVLNTVATPAISRLYAVHDNVRLQRILAYVALGKTVSAFLLSIPFFVAGPYLMKVVFGEEFVGAAGAMAILCGGVIVNGFFGANASLLNMAGLEKRVTRASFASLVSLCLLLPVAVAHYDGEGAAWSATIALTVWNILLWRDAKRFLRLETSALACLRPANQTDRI